MEETTLALSSISPQPYFRASTFQSMPLWIVYCFDRRADKVINIKYEFIFYCSFWRSSPTINSSIRSIKPSIIMADTPEIARRNQLFNRFDVEKYLFCSSILNGVVGLVYLGSTCYMNSAIQCLSKVVK